MSATAVRSTRWGLAGQRMVSFMSIFLKGGFGPLLNPPPSSLQSKVNRSGLYPACLECSRFSLAVEPLARLYSGGLYARVVRLPEVPCYDPAAAGKGSDLGGISLLSRVRVWFGNKRGRLTRYPSAGAQRAAFSHFAVLRPPPLPEIL